MHEKYHHAITTVASSEAAPETRAAWRGKKSLYPFLWCLSTRWQHEETFIATRHVGIADRSLRAWRRVPAEYKKKHANQLANQVVGSKQTVAFSKPLRQAGTKCRHSSAPIIIPDFSCMGAIFIGFVPMPLWFRKKRMLLPRPFASALGSTHWHMRALLYKALTNPGRPPTMSAW